MTVDQFSDVFVCVVMCWECKFDQHCDPPRWHTWADSDDVAHAKATEQPDPRKRRCGCDCADAPKPAEVIRLPKPSQPPQPKRPEHPLRKTPARLRWLEAVAAGTVQASPCDMWTPTGHDVVWYVTGQWDTNMRKWLGHAQVYPLWVPCEHGFAGSRGKRIIRLTAEGRRLLAEWRR